MLTTIGNLVKVFLFFLKFFMEKDEKKSQEKANIASQVVEAFKETDNDKKASKLNAAIGSINRLR